MPTIESICIYETVDELAKIQTPNGLGLSARCEKRPIDLPKISVGYMYSQSVSSQQADGDIHPPMGTKLGRTEIRIVGVEKSWVERKELEYKSACVFYLLHVSTGEPVLGVS